MPKMTRVADLHLDDRIQSISLHPAKGIFAALSLAGDALLFDEDGRELRRWRPHPSGGVGCAWSRDGNCLATCGQDGAIELTRDVDVRTIRGDGNASGCESFAWSSDGTRIARAMGRQVDAFLATDGAVLDEGFLSPSTVVDLAWTRERHLLAASHQGIHRRGADGKASSLGLPEAVSCMEPSPDGAWLANARIPAGATLMGLDTGELLDIAGLQGRLRSIAWSREGRMAALSSQPCLTVWTIPPPSPAERTPRRLWGHAAPVRWLGFSPRGNLLASIDDEGHILVWGESGESPIGRDCVPGPPNTAAWNLNGNRLVVGSIDGTLRITRIG